MAELSRRVLDSLPFLGGATPPEQRTPPAARSTVSVEIRLPTELGSWSDDLGAVMRRHLAGLLRELEVRRDLEVDVSGDAGRPGVVTASVDGRPVAQLDGGALPGEQVVETISLGVMNGVLRRLQLLAGDGVPSPAAYVASLGCRLPEASLRSGGVDAAEEYLDDRADEEIVVEVATSTLRRVDAAGQGAMVSFREQEFRRRGVVYPDVRVVATDGPPGWLQLRLNDVTLPPRTFHDEAGWSNVVACIAGELAARRHWFIRRRDVAWLLDTDLVYVFPELVALTEANYSRAMLTACLRELVRSGRRMRNFPRILWMLLEQGDAQAGPDVLRLAESPLLPKARYRPRADADPVQLAARVRKMAIEESWRLGNFRPLQNAVRLAPEIEERLMTPASPHARALAEWAAVRAVAGVPEVERVVTRTVGAIGPVRDAAQAVSNPPRVMASQELPPDADLADLRILADPQEGT